MIIIFDLDGTLALNEHRQHFLEERPKNWKAFEEACVDDKPNLPLISLYQTLKEWHECHILSGRSEDMKDVTETWFTRHSIFYNKLFMRKSGDYRDDRIVKKEMFQQLKFEYAGSCWDSDFVIFDDRQKVVDMWREIGLTCCQVAPGNF